jgi:hypothetical protein
MILEANSLPELQKLVREKLQKDRQLPKEEPPLPSGPN